MFIRTITVATVIGVTSGLMLASTPVSATVQAPAAAPAVATISSSVVTGHIAAATTTIVTPAAVPAAKKPAPKPAPPPAPAPKPSTPPPVVPVKSDQQTVTDGSSYPEIWEQGPTGFMGFPSSPTYSRFDPGTGVFNYVSRPATGAPEYQNGEGACQQSAGSNPHTVGPNTWPPDGGACAASDPMRTDCALAVNNGKGLLDPLANYSYGSTWNRTEKRRYHDTNGHYYDIITYSDGTTKNGPAYGSWSKHEYTNQITQYKDSWGACQFHGAPYIAEHTDCVIDRTDVFMSGPTGKGLPTRNGPTVADFIVETMYQISKKIAGPDTTDFGSDWKRSGGTKLFGLGPVPASLNALDKCGFGQLMFGAPVKLPGPGNWNFATTQRMTTCTEIVYPGWGARSFQGCTSPKTVPMDVYAWYACSPAPNGSSGQGTAPNNSLNFSPALCGNPPPPAQACVPNIDRGVGVQVWSRNDDGTLSKIPTNKVSTDTYKSVVEADGRDILVSVPPIIMSIPSEPRTTPVNDWVVWRVDTSSTPWEGSASTDPNSDKQPFSGTINGAKKLAVVPPTDQNWDGLPNSITWGSDQRTLQLNFYKAGEPGATKVFRVAPTFAEQRDVTLPQGTVAGTYRDGVVFGGTLDKTYVIPRTCEVVYQNFKVVSTRNAGG